MSIGKKIEKPTLDSLASQLSSALSAVGRVEATLRTETGNRDYYAKRAIEANEELIAAETRVAELRLEIRQAVKDGA